MAEITLQINSETSIDSVILKQALQQIASNFNKENLKAIAELSKKDNVNTSIKKLFDNPFFKAAL